ncbi:LPS translocon maturation chaperone LptM [Bartonella vinsonii]|uniref:Predicted small periplasmic lipoprotein n=1 Tax=Bartonella vinsonii TaxID=33047 RepID=A0A3S4Z322_BARVI|nr:lipoprotein [Bartonella vinsonii]VEJ44549.1 Predicted small periplasmic lipoprotein [Bartonella vinsonii]
MKIILKNLTIVLWGSVMIVGCGRKGALELPPATMMDSSKEASVSQSKADKPFILDRLIQ